jgi:DNA-directed RNA polymerase subunit RPC12/RpoP
MIIWGVRTYHRTVNTGTFHCPKCGDIRQYKHRTGRRFFHLFYIPLIPLKASTEHVRCATCHTRYRPEIIAQAPAAPPAA